MKHLFIVIVLLGLSNYLFSQEKIFVREYTYAAGETDSKITAREKAIAQVKMILLEELGTYVESWVNYNVKESEKINESFFQQEIKTISAGTTETTILNENWNGAEFYIKAQIKADPNEVVRRINQTLSARKSSAVIDSLNLLLNAFKQENQIRSQELDRVKAQLNNQNREIQEKQSTLNTLNQQLAIAKQQLSTYQTQEKAVLSEIASIELKIKSATNKAINNVRKGMTPDEVRQVCGEPRSVDGYSSCAELCYNYGNVFVVFYLNLVVAVIDAKDYSGPCAFMKNYRDFNLLK
jgi:hypothetical protein